MKALNCYNELESNKADYEIHNLNEGMQVAYHQTQGNVILINLIERYVWPVLDADRKLVIWGRDDIDYEKVNKLPDNHHARTRRAPYEFSIGQFVNGVSKVSWMLYPGRMYATSDGGYDVQDNECVMVCALIDTKARILVPFMPMSDYEEKHHRKCYGRVARKVKKNYLGKK